MDHLDVIVVKESYTQALNEDSLVFVAPHENNILPQTSQWPRESCSLRNFYFHTGTSLGNQKMLAAPNLWTKWTIIGSGSPMVLPKSMPILVGSPSIVEGFLYVRLTNNIMTQAWNADFLLEFWSLVGEKGTLPLLTVRY